jgi:uncharacterized Fe-S cluster protein YjdI
MKSHQPNQLGESGTDHPQVQNLLHQITIKKRVATRLPKRHTGPSQIVSFPMQVCNHVKTSATGTRYKCIMDGHGDSATCHACPSGSVQYFSTKQAATSRWGVSEVINGGWQLGPPWKSKVTWTIAILLEIQA